jgi:hypothetical protein
MFYIIIQVYNSKLIKNLIHFNKVNLEMHEIFLNSIRY